MVKNWLYLGVVAALTGLVACGSDVSGPDGGLPSPSIGKTTGGTDSTGGSGGTPTSNGPVVSFTVLPRNLSLPVGYYGTVIGVARDAAGVIVATKVTYTSSNPSIVVASDTGAVYGKALGTAKIYATIAGFKDSATVVVTPARVDSTPVPQPVAEFSMTVVAFGRMPGTDTSRTERVGGSTITLFRVGGILGDTLGTPQLAATAKADANGEAKFTKLVGGSYTIKVAPPAGSPYLETQSAIGPPREKDITVHVTLRRT